MDIEKPSTVPLEEEIVEPHQSKSIIPGSVRRFIQGAALGVGILAGEGAANQIEAQSTKIESVEDSLTVLMERGKKNLGVVFENGGKLYVVIEDQSRDMQLAIDKAKAQAIAIFVKYLTNKENLVDVTVSTRVRQQETHKEGEFYKGIVLVELIRFNK